MNANWSYSPETLNSGQNQQFFVPWDLEIWWMTLKNNRAPLLCCFKLCASVHSHQSIQTKVTVRKRSKSAIFCPVWPWNLTDDPENNRAPLLCYFKLCASFRSHWWIQPELQSGNAQFGSNSTIFFSRVTLKLDGWPWKTGAPLLSNIKLCESFQHQVQIQTGVIVRKRLSWVMTSVTLTFDL